MSTYDLSSASRFRSKTVPSLITSWKQQPRETMTQSPPAMSQIQPTEMAHYRLHSKFEILRCYPITCYTNHQEIYYSIDVIYQSKTYQRPLSDNTPGILPPSPKRLKDIDKKIKKIKKG